MTPKLLLALWRERWAKPGVTMLQVPYIDGRVSQWGIRIAQQMRWSFPGIIIFIAFLTALFGVVLLPTSFSLNNQIVFATFLLTCALFIRPHAGVLPTLILIGLSLVASVRYLYWRFSATLGHDSDTIFVLSFILILAELYLCLQAVLSFIEVRWPIKRGQSNLRNDSNLWPSVDIFVLCSEQSLSMIESTVKAALALDWPKTKTKIFLLDNFEKSDIKNLADSMNVQYLSHSENVDGKLGYINAALMETKGDLVMVLESDHAQDKMVLQHTVGWFLRDAKLGLLLSPSHFLAPKPSKLTLNLFNSCDLDASFALMRRSMLLRLGDEKEHLVTSRERMDAEMRGLGYECAYVGLPRVASEESDASSMDMATLAPSSTPYFRVNQPILSSRLLSSRLRLSSFQVVLNFYQPLARLVFMLAPLPYLFSGVKIVQANLALFVAYIVPHLVHWYMAKGRLESKSRLTIWMDFRETVLAVYLTVLTAISLVKTEFYQFTIKISTTKEKGKPSFDWLTSLPFATIIFLNLMGLVIGLINFPLDRRQEWDAAFFYLIWAFCNLLILSAFAAVAEEVRHIRHYRRLQLSRSVMLKLPLGRSLSCVTENFPEESLTIRLPTPTQLVVGSHVYLSIFRGDREFGFPAQVDSNDNHQLCVHIHESAQADYLAFAEAVYSRGKNWPQWLPDRDADSPLPRWLYKMFDALRTIVVKLRASYKNKSNQKN